MTIAITLHDEAMDFAEEALLAQQHYNEELAQALFRRALELAIRSVELLRNDDKNEPTRSIICRSTATLALDCHEPAIAERYAALGLAGFPPFEIAEELRNVMERATFDRHLQMQGVELLPNDVRLVLNGPAVSSGLAPAPDVLERVKGLEKLVLRTVERFLKRPFQDRGVMADIRKAYQLFFAAPQPSSFAWNLRFGATHEQLTLFDEKQVSVQAVVQEITDCLVLYNKQEEKELKHRFEDTEEAYYRNFVGLAHNILPDGNHITFLALTTSNTDVHSHLSEHKSVILHHRGKRIVLEQQSTKPKPENHLSVTGQLLTADKTETSYVVIIERDTGKRRRIIVPPGMMADVVKPFWEETVQANIKRTGHRWELETIQRVDE